MSQPGKLHVIATPIGNLGDMCTRAVEVLRSVDLILAEDTRSFGTLSKRFDIPTKVESFFEHNEREKTSRVLDVLHEGQSVALVSEAGTPLISDPGYHLVKACQDNQIEVSGVPGPSALIFALSISGFEVHSFVFEGFLPVKSGKRSRLLQQSLDSGRTCVFYESPYRILKTLQQLVDLESEREIFIGRELTKLHEECVRGSAETVLQHFKAKDKIKGEFVLIIRGIPRKS